MKIYYFVILTLSIVLCAHSDNGIKGDVDSLESKQSANAIKVANMQKRLDSLNSIVKKTYENAGLQDTITGEIEKNGIAYEKPDIISKKKFKITAKEIVVIIAYKNDWFKIIHKRGIGYILSGNLKHDDKIFNYKK